MSSFTTDKMFEIYTFFENTTEICRFSKIGPKFTLFSKIGSKFIFAFCSKIGPKISNILSMVDEVNIRYTLALKQMIKGH